MNSSVFHSNSLPTRNVPFNFGAPYPDVLRLATALWGEEAMVGDLFSSAMGRRSNWS